MKRAGPLALLAILWTAACVPDARRPDHTAAAYQLIVDAEDARPVGGDALSTLLDAAGLDDPFLRRTAVRALGRLENPGLSQAIARQLADEDPGVRAAAAEALAQSVHGADGAAVIDVLLERSAHESDPRVRGALARSIGRLSVPDARRQDIEDTLVGLAGTIDDAPTEALLGVALGFESLTRFAVGSGIGRPAADLLMELMTYRRDGGEGAASSDAGHVRALAVTSLGRSRRLSRELIEVALDDPEPEVRRAVVGYVGVAPPSAREDLVRRALADTTARVATEAIRYLAQLIRTEPRCAQLIAAAQPDIDPAVRIPALEALGQPCATIRAQRETLVRSASELGELGSTWQPAARALLSLTRIDAEAASRLLPRYVEHESPFVRVWAARTAGEVRDVAALFTLAVDRDPNVRNAAALGLFEIEGHGLDDYLLEQLEGDDPQLLITISGLLEGSPNRRRTALAMLAAFERISRAQRETWRDPRMALLRRLAGLGDASLTERLIPFLSDYDPVVAASVAEILETWTGTEHDPEPVPLPRAPVPDRAELGALESARLILRMRGGGSLVIELLADQATTNVARVVRLARAGYYDGLTFHRRVPNFVIQGGSPDANEYQGDGPYTRDEVGGLPHWRGTMGISTRGRDTGDGQVFINLVDNPRLDHEYTVVGFMLEGYDILDRILEGDVIEQAEVETGR